MSRHIGKKGIETAILLSGYLLQMHHALEG